MLINTLTGQEMFDRLSKEHQEHLTDMFEGSGLETWEGFLECCIKDYIINPVNKICKACMGDIVGFDIDGICEDCIADN